MHAAAFRDTYVQEVRGFLGALYFDAQTMRNGRRSAVWQRVNQSIDSAKASEQQGTCDSKQASKHPTFSLPG